MSVSKQQTLSQRTIAVVAILLGTSVTLVACGGNEHEEVMAVDRVEEAAEMARANAPEPEPLKPEDILVVPAVTAETIDMDATGAEAGTTEAATTDSSSAEPATADTTSKTTAPDEMSTAAETQ